MIAAAALVVLTTGLALARRAVRPVALPTPTGQHAVGRMLSHWVDAARAELFAPAPGAHREIAAFLWYPSERPPAARAAEYLPAAWSEPARSGWWAVAQSPRSVRPHALEGSPPALSPARFPVLLLSPGIGRIPLDYTALAEDLASHGYLVAGVTPTYSAREVVFPDGRRIRSVPAASDPGPTLESYLEMTTRLLPIWTADLRFAIDRLEALDRDPGSPLARRLDLARLGIVGHSFGGTAATEVCRVDARCRAAVNFDGDVIGEAVKTGLPRPFLFVWTSDPAPAAFAPLVADALSAIRASRAASGFQVAGTRHNDFSDDPLFWSALPLRSRLLGEIGPRAVEVTREIVRAFFDRALGGDLAAGEPDALGAIPEVRAVR